MIPLFTFMPILTLFIILAVIFTTVMRSRTKNYGKDFEDFINEEREANSVKNKPLDNEMFFVPDISLLPIKPDNHGDMSPVLKRQREALRWAQKKMIRFDAPMTNTELKFKYGTMNLEYISEYEENFFKYTYALNDWAESLIEEGDEDSAESILKVAIGSGSETSKTYTMLADIYFKNGKREEMRGLYDIVSGKRMPAQKKTWNYINDYYVKMGL